MKSKNRRPSENWFTGLALLVGCLFLGTSGNLPINAPGNPPPNPGGLQLASSPDLGPAKEAEGAKIPADRMARYLKAIREKGLKVDFGPDGGPSTPKAFSATRAPKPSTAPPEPIFHFRSSGSGPEDVRFSGLNPAQGFQVDFNADRLVITPDPAASAIGDNWLVSMNLMGIGRGDRLQKISGASLTASEGMVTIHRQGVSEWYVNSPSGLEQGFTIQAKPQGKGLELRIELSVESTLRPVILPDDQALVFKQDQSESALSYSGLQVLDARGESIPARLELVRPEDPLEPARIAILVDDSTATYPIVVDPILQVQLVKDINTLTTGMATSYISQAELSGFLYFTATANDITLRGIWKTDGTEAGTIQVKAMHAQGLYRMGSILLFLGWESATGWELWRTDGTGPGTVLAKDIFPGPTNSQISALTSMGSYSLFFADDGLHGLELWKTDGTESGTMLVKDINPGPANTPFSANYPRAMGDLCFFGASVPAFGRELWRSDGTEAGTFMLKDVNPGSGSSFDCPPNVVDICTTLIVADGTLYFNPYAPSIGRELWKTDGTSEGTVLFKDHNPSSNSNTQGGFSGATVGSMLVYSWGSDIWSSDGTAAGTQLIKAGIRGWEFTQVGNALFFVGWEALTGEEIWRTDGTPSGTTLVKDIRPGNPACMPLFSRGPYNLKAVGDLLLFNAWEPSTGGELWKSDGTESGTILVKDLNPDHCPCTESCDEYWPMNFHAMGGILYFWAKDRLHDFELWRSDGTEVGTQMVKDIETETQSGYVGASSVEFQSALYFIGDDGISGRELWQSDGTESGTVLFRDICPGPYSGLGGQSFLMVLGSRLLFGAFPCRTPGTLETGPGELWSTDGTIEGTSRLKVFDTYTQGISPKPFCIMGEELFFLGYENATGAELWVTDGTVEGTRIVKDIFPGPKTGGWSELEPWKGVAIGNVYYFPAAEPTTGRELWRTDGTEFGTWLVADTAPGPQGNYYVSRITSLGNLVLFQVDQSATGVEWWRSDGTSAGTGLLKDVYEGPNDSYSTRLGVIGNTMFFGAYGTGIGYELWKTDGTSEGTMLVKDVNPGPGNGIATEVSTIVIGNIIYFGGSEPMTGTELWKSDGTPAGTLLVKDIYPGAGSSLNSTSSASTRMVDVNSTLFFTAHDPAAGQELWKSDGTGLGTVLVRDIYPGPEGSNPSIWSEYFCAIDGALFFPATAPSTGQELWVSDGTESGTFLVADINPTMYQGMGSSQTYPNSSNPKYFKYFNGRLYFTANDGSHGTEMWSLFECDVPPAVTITSPASGFLTPVNSPIALTGTLSDWIWDRPHTALWTFTSATAPVFQMGGIVSDNNVRGTVSFSTPGIYTLELTITDNKGTSGTANTINGLMPAYVVVFDPLGSFVTGGGWIWSPPGAYRPGIAEYATLEGRANFGFVARYQKGANIPDGSTEFQFRAGDLNFRSTEYQWLVVAGARAQYKGSGTVNGQGDYGFMLTAIDGQVPGGRGYDRFRIKIWDKATDLLVYDNHVGAVDNAELPDSTIIQGGNIVIH